MRPKFGLIAAITAIVACFWAIDLFLARTERVEVEGEARRDADAGQHLLAAGHAEEAVDLLRKAHALERDNTGYTLALAEALMRDSKLDEAQSLETEVLERTPNNGEANLVEARIMVRRGQAQESSAYYHRAIYGIWPENAAQHRMQVRLELANLLAARHADQELLAELLPLETEAQNDVAVRTQVARLYVMAGSPARAVLAYRSLIRDDPADGESYAGLGEAELSQGNYRGAQAAFQNAIRRGDNVQARLDLAARMADLDPTPRGLSAAEKLARSTEILRLAAASLAQCPSSDQIKKLEDNANALLLAKVKGPATNEMAENRLAMAQELWQLRPDTCPALPAGEPLQLIMAKLSQ